MNALDFSLADVATVLGLVASGGAGVWAVLRTKLGMDFASRGSVVALDARVDAVESRLSVLPNAADMARLSERVAAVERSVLVGNSELSGIRQLLESEYRNTGDKLGRMERQVGMLFQHELSKEKGLHE